MQRPAISSSLGLLLFNTFMFMLLFPRSCLLSFAWLCFCFSELLHLCYLVVFFSFLLFFLGRFHFAYIDYVCIVITGGSPRRPVHVKK